MAIQLQGFLDKHPSGPDLVKADPSKLQRYRGHLPDCLLELWATHGFGFYGRGLIQIIDPDRYRKSLWSWLMLDEEDMTRLPIALTPFGEVFYYRKLTDSGDEDVSFLDPHVSEGGCVVWSLAEFFNDWCCDEEGLPGFFNQALFGDAIALKGSLEKDQMYFFVPALRLGGDRSPGSLERGDALAHLDLLLQLALAE